MRIVSAFHDYYDSALAHGHDDRLTYVREPRTILRGWRWNDDEFTFLDGDTPGSCDRATPDRSLQARIEPFLVVVGIKVYPGVAVTIPHSGRMPDVRMSYASEDLTRYLTSLGVSTDDKDSRFPGRLDRLATFLDRPVREVPVEFMVRHKAALMLVRTSNVVINAQLKSIEFYRRLTAAEVFQELEMFLGGVLAPENRPMVEIEDKHRITQHGFDKYSFRKAPQKRAARR